MDAYVYQADLLCEECALAERERLNLAQQKANRFENIPDDSEHWPCGPYPEGGGEADCPQHCGACHVFLENPLTNDGAQYAAEAIRDYYVEHQGSEDVIKQWVAEYRDYEPVREVVNAVEVLELEE